MDTNELLINMLIYIFLPVWGIAGFVDWCCHRATKIEITSGLFESFLHSLMGIQIAIPILLCLLFEVNVLVFLICIAAWLMHEIVAHWDVHFASPRREISLWEVHAHNYLATIPIFMLLLVGIIHWPVVVDVFTLNWIGQLQFVQRESVIGVEGYLPAYLIFMTIICVFPYAEENFRCLIYYFKKKGDYHE